MEERKKRWVEKRNLTLSRQCIRRRNQSDLIAQSAETEPHIYGELIFFIKEPGNPKGKEQCFGQTME